MASASVAIIGASNNPERYSYMAVASYLERAYEVWPVHPSGISVANLPCYTDIASLPGHANIISLYINPKRGLDLLPDLIAHKPDWVWLNPGADSDELEEALKQNGLKVMRSCNLVALRMGDPAILAQQHHQQQQQQ